jgi:hypothetical protein
MSNLGHRYYQPGMGRWMSRDPIEEEGGMNIYGFVADNPIGLIDDSGMKVFGGTWDMFLNYFGFAPESGQLSGEILAKIKNSQHMKDWKKWAEIGLRSKLECCKDGNARIPHNSTEDIDDVLPLGLTLGGSSSGGNWQTLEISDCKWKCGGPSGGPCDCTAKCTITVTISKYYTFNKGFNPANSKWPIWLANWLAWMNNYFQDPSFNVNGTVTDAWDWAGKK